LKKKETCIQFEILPVLKSTGFHPLEPFLFPVISAVLRVQLQQNQRGGHLVLERPGAAGTSDLTQPFPPPCSLLQKRWYAGK